MAKITQTLGVLFEDLFSSALEEKDTGQIYLSIDADLSDPDQVSAIWSRIGLGFEVTSQFYDVELNRDCFVIDRIKP